MEPINEEKLKSSVFDGSILNDIKITKKCYDLNKV